MVQSQNLRELRTFFEYVSRFIGLHKSPITRQPEITDCVKRLARLLIVFNQKPALLEDVNLLLNGKERLGVFHIRTTKKWPALVRCIPFGREAMAGSIAAKIRNLSEIIKCYTEKERIFCIVVEECYPQIAISQFISSGNHRNRNRRDRHFSQIRPNSS